MWIFPQRGHVKDCLNGFSLDQFRPPDKHPKLGALYRIIRFAPSLADLIRLRARRMRVSFLQSRGSVASEPTMFRCRFLSESFDNSWVKLKRMIGRRKRSSSQRCSQSYVTIQLKPTALFSRCLDESIESNDVESVVIPRHFAILHLTL